MHPWLTEQLVHDHHRTLEREAREHALATVATASAAANRAATPGAYGFMPHVRDRSRLRRAIAALVRPSPA